MMSHRFLCISLIFCINISISAQSNVEYANTITQEDLKKHLTIIAADNMEGRETGSAGQFRAAEYISNQFKAIGLKPILKDSAGNPSYYQYFNLFKKGWSQAYVKIGRRKKVFFKDFYPVGLVNVPEEITRELVFLGHGIKSEEYNDYANKTIAGKAVIYFAENPEIVEDKDTKKIDPELLTEKGKSEQAFLEGATTVFVISDQNEEVFESLAAERKAVLSRYNRMMLTKSAPTLETEQPKFIVSAEMAAQMLGISLKKLNKLKDWHKNKGVSPAGELKNQEITYVSKRGDNEVKTMNVLGMIEGSTKKDEVLVITAHYDHVGITEKGEVYNGADDDGSGTCAILELAEAFAKAAANGNRPERSILFMTVSGEEKGLLGSQYFTDVDPAVPLNQIIANLNIDMIGRIDKEHQPKEEYVYLIGSDKLSSELHEISEAVNKEYINYEIDYTYNKPDDPNRFYYRSDHYNFAKNKIPVIFYFSGVHEDYHKTGDDEFKILYPKYTQLVKYVFYTAWELANRPERIKVDSNKP